MFEPCFFAGSVLFVFFLVFTSLFVFNFGSSSDSGAISSSENEVRRVFESLLSPMQLGGIGQVISPP